MRGGSTQLYMDLSRQKESPKSPACSDFTKCCVNLKASETDQYPLKVQTEALGSPVTETVNKAIFQQHPRSCLDLDGVQTRALNHSVLVVSQ